MNFKNWVVTDPNHQWSGKVVRMVANAGRGALSGYLISYGIQRDWVVGDQIKKIEEGDRKGRPKKTSKT